MCLQLLRVKLTIVYLILNLSINGYRLVRRDRDRRGGGISVFIKNKFQITDVRQHDDIDVLNLYLKIGNSPKFTCVVVHRPPYCLNILKNTWSH